jgi:predicted nucleotidyltransferase
MLGKEYTFQQKIDELKEREKELKSLYKVEEAINRNLPLDDFFMQLVKRLSSGWQYPEICRIKITFEDKEYREKYWEETEWVQHAEIVVDDNVLGKIEVFYTAFRKMVVDSQFLPEEQKLLNTIAARIGTYIFNKRLEKSIEILQNEKDKPVADVPPVLIGQPDNHWIWRKNMAEIIAGKLEMERFDVKGIYLIGSTKNANAGPASDIDLLVHVGDDLEKLREFKAWMEGWSLCLSEMNYLKTGYKTKGLIDLHIVTDEDIQHKTSFGVMIGNHTDGAKPIKVIIG